MAGFINAVRPAPVLDDDWTARLPPGSLPRSVRAGVDPRLELRPGVDPGYDMPNPPPENLNQDNSRATGFLNAAYALPAGAPAAADPSDFTDRYNTRLTPEQEAAFQAWGKRLAGEGGRNPAADTFDYDMRGFWAAADGDPQFAENGHAGDRYKKPNHPTFSDQSQYHGVDGHEGGTWGGGNGEPWTFTPGRSNLQFRDIDELQQYFDEREKGNRLIAPTADLMS